MNLAVHGLEGTIRAGNEAITYYEDPHELVGKCDFVMANPPFNVDEVDAEKVKGDQRLPFGLPGVNKAKKVSNGNYLWMSYFYSYLNENGPRRLRHVLAGVERRARRGDGAPEDGRDRRRRCDDRYPRQLLLHAHRALRALVLRPGKEKDAARRDHVLMLDARHIFRKVSRSIYDFSPEQQKNIAAIVWLYRGQQERFLKLVESYLAEAVALARTAQKPLAAYEEALGKLVDLMEPFAKAKREGRSARRAVGRTHQRAGDADGGYRSLRQGSGGAGQGMGQGGARQCRAERGAAGAAPAGGSLPRSDQADRPCREAGGPGDRHRGEGACGARMPTPGTMPR